MYIRSRSNETPKDSEPVDENGNTKSMNQKQRLLDERKVVSDQLASSDTQLKTTRWTGVGILAFGSIYAFLHGVHYLFISGYSLIFFLIPRDSSREIRLREIDDQLDQIDIEETDIDFRAERQLKLHQQEVKRYYDLTLDQSRWVLYLGGLCVVLGLAIVGVTLYFVFQTPLTADKIITGTIGAIGTILANFVAAIYLKMHAGAVESLVKFHNRLVNTNRLFFAYFLATKIDEDVTPTDATLMDQTLSQMALTVTKADAPEIEVVAVDKASDGKGAAKTPKASKPAE